jgi:hypothetical protein
MALVKVTVAGSFADIAIPLFEMMGVQSLIPMHAFMLCGLLYRERDERFYFLEHEHALHFLNAG